MRSGSIDSLVDTNILFYGYDAADPAKRDRARDVVQRLIISGSGYLSAQIVGEFYTNVKRKLAGLVDAEGEAEIFMQTWPVLDLTSTLVAEAIRISARYKIAYFDALLCSTAGLNGLPILLTEDLQHGQLIEGVRILNPLRPDFDLALLD